MVPKKHIITIAGYPGSGKSTIARLLAEELTYSHFSSGDLFRQLANEQGQELMEALVANQQKLSRADELVDERLQEIARRENRLVIDSRMAWHWIPSSFKVFLKLDIPTAAQRIMKQAAEHRRATEHISSNTADYIKALKKRVEVETVRYKNFYNLNIYDTNNYDLVVDTSKNDAAQSAQIILKGYAGWLKSEK